jgi:hypothetical protein
MTRLHRLGAAEAEEPRRAFLQLDGRERQRPLLRRRPRVDARDLHNLGLDDELQKDRGLC